MGTKEAKTVVDSTVSPVKTTKVTYIRNFQYTNDSLNQASLPEGRARWQKQYYLNGDSLYRFNFDYFLKDHLGNTRVILTTEKDTAEYMATMEAAYRTKENALFYNIDSTSYATASVPGGYPTDNTTTPNDSVAMVEGNAGEHTQGPALLLKVMTGDSISIGVKSYYVGGGTAGSNSSSLNSVLNTLAGGLVALGGGGGEGTVANLNNMSGSPVFSALNSYFYPTYDSTPGSKPKAYLNWMLLDNQFNCVSGNNQSGAIPVGSPNVLNTLSTTIKLKHSGYLYIWVSNETQNWQVFFDNLSVLDFSGPMLEETHYYPFGLTMAGISDKALKSNYAENKYRFNGKELQHQEFSDGSGFEVYDYGARFQDPQLGRWFSIDPLADSTYPASPYAYSVNNPVLLPDVNGKDWTITRTEDKNGNVNYNILFTGAVLNSSSDKNINTQALAQSIQKQIESLFTTVIEKNSDGSLKVGVEAHALIDVVNSKGDLLSSQTLFEVKDATDDDFKTNQPGSTILAVAKDGKDISINASEVNDIISGSNSKTMPHEVGHTGGLRHPNMDYNSYLWGLIRTPGITANSPSSNFMYQGRIANPTGPTKAQIERM